MSPIYIISDNQYFAMGIEALLPPDVALIVSPHKVLNDSLRITGKLCYIYVKNRTLHRQICSFLKHINCRMIFFLPEGKFLNTPKLISWFWSARISLEHFRQHSKQVASFFKETETGSISSARYRRVIKVAEGLDRYMVWVRSHGISRSMVHNHHRALITTMGIEKVNIHSLFLSEYIAAGYIAANKRHRLK